MNEREMDMLDLYLSGYGMPLGLTTRKRILLHLMEMTEPETIEMIAEAVRKEIPQVRRLLYQLERDGLVEMSRGNDRRMMFGIVKSPVETDVLAQVSESLATMRPSTVG